MAFQLGIYDFGHLQDLRQRRSNGLFDASVHIRRYLDFARLAEASGYSRIWLAEHHNEDSAESSPETMAAYMGAATTRIRVGTGVMILPYHAPLQAADTFRQLSASFPGRLDVGIGRGPAGNRETSDALSCGAPDVFTPESFSQRVDDFMAYLEGAPAPGDASGRVKASPTDAPTPQVWMVGARGPSLSMAARHGVSFAVSYFLKDTRRDFDLLEDAKATREEYLEKFQPNARQARPHLAIAVTVACAPTDEEAQALEEEARKGGAIKSSVVGSPETCRKALEELQRTYGAHEFIVGCVIYSWAKKMRSFELLAKACLQEAA